MYVLAGVVISLSGKIVLEVFLTRNTPHGGTGVYKSSSPLQDVVER